MLKALQVLRIHLLELEKVQELCRDFCRRYIACLRGKLHSENLLRTEGESGGLDGDEAGYDSNCSNGSGSHPFNLDAVAASYSSQYRRDERLVSQDDKVQWTFYWLMFCFSTHQPSSRPSQVSYVQSSLSSDEEEDAVGGNPNPSAKVKRGVLPRKATAVLRSWLFQHLVHPYPTEEEKKQLATQTKLTLLQVFSNKNNLLVAECWYLLSDGTLIRWITGSSTPDEEFCNQCWIRPMLLTPDLRPYNRTLILLPNECLYLVLEAVQALEVMERMLWATVIPTSKKKVMQDDHFVLILFFSIEY